MAKQTLKDNRGQTIGYIEDNTRIDITVYDAKRVKKGTIRSGFSGSLTATDARGTKVAEYNPSRDITNVLKPTRSSHRGNVLTSVLLNL